MLFPRTSGLIGSLAHGTHDGRLPVRRPPAGVRRVRQRPAPRGAPARAAVLPQDAPPPGADARRARASGRLPRPARPRRLGPPAGDGQLLDDAFGRQAIALLDHLEVDKAVVGGTSLGANAALEATAAAPERVRGLLVEMPVLDNALLGCALAFTPLLVEPDLRGADRPPVRRRGAAGAAHRVAAARHDARLGQPGPQAVGVGAPGAVLRPRRAALRGAPRADPADAGDRPLPRPRPPLLGLGHAGPRAAQRPARGGVLDPRAAAHAGAPDRRDRRVRRALLQARPKGGSARRRTPARGRRDAHKAS